MNEPKRPFITITYGISGYFAILVSWYEDENDGMWDITQSGIGRYEKKEDAEREGREWAEAEEIEFK